MKVYRIKSPWNSLAVNNSDAGVLCEGGSDRVLGYVCFVSTWHTMCLTGERTPGFNNTMSLVER